MKTTLLKDLLLKTTLPKMRLLNSVVANFQRLELALAAHIFAVGTHPEVTCQISDL